MTAGPTIVRAWLARCRAAPGQTAMRHKRRGIWNAITWQDYQDAVLRIAAGLDRAGIGRGAVVSIVSESRPEWLHVDMAAQVLGCVGHGIHPTGSPSQVAGELALAGSGIVFVENAGQAAAILEAAAALPALRRIVVFDARGLRAIADDRVVPLQAFIDPAPLLEADRARLERWVDEVQAGDVAFLASSAGGSGAVRLVAITHEAALARAAAMGQALDVRAADRCLCFVPLANVAQRMFSAVLPLLLECHVHFPESAATVANDLREIQPDWVHAPPRFWEKLVARTESTAMLSSPWSRHLFRRCTDAASRGWLTALSRRHIRRAMGLARARVGYSGGAPAAASLQQWFGALGLPLVDLYESAEACGPALRLPLAAPDGDAALGTRIRILEGGELALHSASLCAGHWDRGLIAAADLTPDGWLRTGDRVAREAAGLRIAGRLRDQFPVHGGTCVSPAAIERELHANPFIANAIVVGDPFARCACLLALELDTVMSFAQSQGIPFVDASQLLGSDAVRALVQAQIDTVNARLQQAERIGGFALMSLAPEPGDEAMDPTLRLRRAVLLRRHEDQFRQLATA